MHQLRGVHVFGWGGGRVVHESGGRRNGGGMELSMDPRRTRLQGNLGVSMDPWRTRIRGTLGVSMDLQRARIWGNLGVSSLLARGYSLLRPVEGREPTTDKSLELGRRPLYLLGPRFCFTA